MYKENRGFLFEKIAQNYLVDRNYKILETNFFCRFGEIDLICKKDETIVFVEVKGRKNTNYGYPREYVTEHKIKRIISTAKYYLFQNQYDNFNCRFDVIEIITDTRSINHIENAFY